MTTHIIGALASVAVLASVSAAREVVLVIGIGRVAAFGAAPCPDATFAAERAFRSIVTSASENLYATTYEGALASPMSDCEILMTDRSTDNKAVPLSSDVLSTIAAMSDPVRARSDSLLVLLFGMGLAGADGAWILGRDGVLIQTSAVTERLNVLDDGRNYRAVVARVHKNPDSEPAIWFWGSSKAWKMLAAWFESAAETRLADGIVAAPRAAVIRYFASETGACSPARYRRCASTFSGWVDPDARGFGQVRVEQLFVSAEQRLAITLRTEKTPRYVIKRKLVPGPFFSVVEQEEKSVEGYDLALDAKHLSTELQRQWVSMSAAETIVECVRNNLAKDLRRERLVHDATEYYLSLDGSKGSLVVEYSD